MHVELTYKLTPLGNAPTPSLTHCHTRGHLPNTNTNKDTCTYIYNSIVLTLASLFYLLKLTNWAEESEGVIAPPIGFANENGVMSGRQHHPNSNGATGASLPPPHPTSSSSTSTNVNHSIFRAPISASRPPTASSPPPGECYILYS